MLQKKYRFWQILNGCRVWVVFGDEGEIFPTENRQEATLFTERDWQSWGKDEGFSREEIGVDEMLRRMGAPTLPGLE